MDKAEANFRERVAQIQVWFGEARQELKAAQEKLDERKRELLLKQADIKKAQEVAKEQAAKDEANRRQQQGACRQDPRQGRGNQEARRAADPGAGAEAQGCT